MIDRKSILGICILCALMLGVIVAQSAQAVPGATFVTCEKVAKAANQFTDAHCKEKGEGEFKHVEFAPNTTTTATINNNVTGAEVSPLELKATVASLGVALTAKKATAHTTLENKENATEMWGEGKTIKKEAGSSEGVVFEEATANLGCTVTGLPGGVGKVETQPVSATTKGAGTMATFTPTVGTKIAEFELSGAGCPEFVKAKYPIFGSVTCVIVGATCVFTHTEVTGTKTLRLKNATEGPVAGLSGSITIKAKDKSNEATGEWPISATGEGEKEECEKECGC